MSDSASPSAVCSMRRLAACSSCSRTPDASFFIRRKSAITLSDSSRARSTILRASSRAFFIAVSRAAASFSCSRWAASRAATISRARLLGQLALTARPPWRWYSALAITSSKRTCSRGEHLCAPCSITFVRKGPQPAGNLKRVGFAGNADSKACTSAAASPRRTRRTRFPPPASSVQTP